MARFVDDLILALPVIAGPDWIDPHIAPAPLQDPAKVAIRGLRVAIHVNNGIVTPTPATQDAVRAAGRVLTGRGARVEERTPPGLADAFEIAGRLQFGDGGAWALRLIEGAGTRGNSSLGWLANLPRMTSTEYARGIEDMDRFRSRLLGFMQNTDVIICPAHPTPAVRHGGSRAPEFGEGDSYSVVYNVTGWPAAVVRAATSPVGLPIAVQVVGRPWREDQVLAVAKVIESEMGGWKRPPNL
jgi:amidase